MVPCLLADNPQQSEEASHTGVNANRKDRKSQKGGTPAERESDSGYHELYGVSTPDTATAITEVIFIRDGVRNIRQEWHVPQS